MPTRRDSGSDHSFSLPLGHDTLVIERRYEFLSIVNDFLVALWFLVGSICLFFPELEALVNWCFIIGSAELMIRPVIRLSRHVHLRKTGSQRSGSVGDF